MTRKHITFYCDPDIAELLKKASKNKRCSEAYIIRQALLKYFYKIEGDDLIDIIFPAIRKLSLSEIGLEECLHEIDELIEIRR